MIAALAGRRQARPEGQGRDPLMQAADVGNAKAVERLLSICDSSARDKDGFTALIIAAMRGHTECVRMFLRSGDVLARSSGGGTPLIAAAVFGHLDCVAALLPHSDAAARDSSGLCAMDWARDAGHAAEADILAPFSPPEATAQAFERFGAEGMPGWAAKLEADELAASIGLTREAGVTTVSQALARPTSRATRL